LFLERSQTLPKGLYANKRTVTNLPRVLARRVKLLSFLKVIAENAAVIAWPGQAEDCVHAKKV